MPIDDAADSDADVPTPWSHRSSYIAGKSAPTTPKILSRSPSSTRIGRTSSNKLAGSRSYTSLANAEAEALKTSKSATHFLDLRQKNPKIKARHVRQSGSDAGEWLYRSGAAISSEARESKGQSWIVRRESSTSLVDQDDDDDDESQFIPVNGSGRNSRTHSRVQSRAHSRPPSRLASAVSSRPPSRRDSRNAGRPDMTYFSTPGLAGPARTPGGTSRLSKDVSDYFSNLHGEASFDGPDFVDDVFDDDDDDDSDSSDEEGRRDEDEVRRLTSNEAFGFGGLVERLLGWAYLNVKDDGFGNDEDDEGADAVSVYSAYSAGTSQAPTPRRRASGGLATPSFAPLRPLTLTQSEPAGVSKGKERAVDGGEAEAEADADADADAAPADSYGWTDAAWLLSVASKALF